MSRVRGLLALALAIGGMVGAGQAAHASAYLDQTFDGDGISQLPSEAVDVPDSVLVIDTWRMADGRVVVAGETGLHNCDLTKWWIGRFTADGQPDPTFGGGTGVVQFVPQGVTTCNTSSSDRLRMLAVAVQSTGKIVVGGGPSLTLVRLDVDGSFDPTFPKPFWPSPPTSGSSQCVPSPPVRSGGEVWDLAIDPHDDTVLAAGRVARRTFMSGCPSSTRWGMGPAVFRFDEDSVTEVPGPWGQSTTLPEVVKVAVLSDGTPVAATGTSLHWLGDIQVTVPDVYVPASYPYNDIVGLVVDSQDRVTLATLFGEHDYDTVALHRFTGGVADPTFGTGGEVLEPSVGRVAGIAVDSADRLVLAGSRSDDIALRVGRLTVAGALDPTFGDGGVRRDDVVEDGEGPFYVNPLNVWVGGNDQLTVLGFSHDTITTFVFGRYLGDGTPDPALDDNGFELTPVVVTVPEERDARMNEFEVAPSGETFALLGRDIVKWRADGSPDLAFGGDGRVEGPSDRSFSHFAVDHSGDVVVVGNYYSGTNNGWVGRLDGSTGAPDPTFGSNGSVELPQRHTRKVVVDSADRPIVSVTDSNPTTPRLIRLGTDGAPDPTFGTGGVATVPIFPADMAIDSADRVAVTTSNPMDIVRFTASGSVDASFATTRVTGNLQELLVDPSDRLLVITSSTHSAHRILPTGGLDPSFAEAGRLREPSQLDDPHAAVDAAGRLVLVGKHANTNDVAVVRYTDAGVLDTTFATNGRARLRPPLADGRALHDSDSVLAGVDGTGRIVVGARTARPSTYTTKQVTTLFRLVPEPPADAAGPQITITTPAHGATYLSTDAIVANYTCSDVGSDVDRCFGDLPNGAPLDTWPGPRQFTAGATDLAGNSSSVTVDFTVLDAASAAVTAGGSVGTGNGFGQWVNDPLDTEVTTPNAGTVTITEHPVTGSPPGYALLGWRAEVTAPPASVAQPLRLTFWLDSSALGALDATTVQVFRNGALVPPCDDPGTAAPDPCVSDRQVLGDGDARLDVLTSAASAWTFGRMLDATPPAISITSPLDGARFTLGQVVTAEYSCSDGGSGIASCAGPVASGGAVDTATAGSHTFTVTATDAADNSSTAVSSYQVLAGSVSATATGPAVVGTDPGGLGASPTIPVQTRLDVADGASGQFSLAAEPAGAPPAGYVALPTAVAASGPSAASTSSPHVVTFTLDASIVGELAPAQIDVVAAGVPLAACAGGTAAAPDPCVASRTDGPDGDVVVAVRTTELTTWTFARRSFIVTSASPASRAQGASAQTVVLTGDGFQAGATAKVSGTGVSVSSSTWLSPTSLQLTLTVGATAPIGSRDITVTNPGKATAVCATCFTIAAKPTVSSLSPTARPRGTSHAVIHLTGTGLQPGATVSFAGTGITVHSVTFVDPTGLDLDVSIDASAATGARAVTVANPDGGTVTKPGALTVNVQPAITSAVPGQLRQGQTLSVVINGSGFPANFVTAEGTVSFGEGIIVGPIVRNSSSKLTASVAVDAVAVPGVRAVTVTNPDTGTATCVACATVVVDPQVTSVAPPDRARGTTGQVLTIGGSGFQPGAVVKVAGTGVTVTATSVADPSTVTVEVSVGASAPLGARDLTVTNPDTGTAICAGCFTVNAKPTVGTLTPTSGPRGAVGHVVQVAGTGFQPGLAVSLSGTGVTATVVAVTPTTMTLAIDVAPDAPTGARSLTVINPDAGSATKSNAFRVT